jgi:hypothetical protein
MNLCNLRNLWIIPLRLFPIAFGCGQAALLPSVQNVFVILCEKNRKIPFLAK